MHVGLVGGIFHHSPAQRQSVQPTTEMILAAGLRRLGHQVTELSPRDFRGLLSAPKRGVDLIHVHHPGRITTWLGFNRHALPVVYTPHRTHAPPKWVLTAGHLALLRRAARVVALSPTESDRLAEDAHVDPSRVSVIPNGLDDKCFPFSQRYMPLAEKRWQILFVGQLIPVKRPSLVLDAIDCLQLRDRVEVRYVYHREQMLEQLRRDVTRRGLQDIVTFVGKRSGSDLRQEYEHAHLLVLPSQAEALPSVITEAVFTGLPVVASDVGGLGWQLDGFGKTVRDMHAESLRAALIDALGSYGELAHAAPAAARSFRQRFGLEEMLRRHVEMYQCVLTERNFVDG